MKAFVSWCMMAALVTGAPSLRAERTLMIGQGLPADGYIDRCAELVLKEAYAKLGVSVTFTKLPAERVLHELNAGRIDGDAARVDGLAKKYPNIVPVPVPIAYLKFVAFSRRTDIRPQGWQRMRPYSIVVRRGVKRAEDGTEGMDRLIVPSTKQAMFRMLAVDRADVAIDTDSQTAETFDYLKSVGIHMLAPPLETSPMYHYLNTRHTELAAQLAAVLEQMESSGHLQQLQEEALAEMRGSGSR